MKGESRIERPGGLINGFLLQKQMINLSRGGRGDFPQQELAKLGTGASGFYPTAMQVESIEEPIDVIGKFHRGKVVPMRLRWQGRIYEVNRITASWTYSQGQHKEYHYSLLTRQEDLWEICLDSRTLCWTLQRIFLEG